MKINITSIRKFIGTEKFREIVRFGIVGVLATAVHYGIYLSLDYLTGYHNPSFIIGYICSFAMNFFLSNVFTFKTKPTVKKGVGFAASHAINLLLQVAFLNLFLYLGVSSEIAPIPVFCIVIPINFLLVRTALKKL